MILINFCSSPQRYVLSLMGFFALVNAYTMRSCLSLAITEMTKVPVKSDGALRFNWDKEEQGIIMGSFYIGYVITHLPAALLCKHFGAKNVLCFGILLTAIFTLITPIAVEYGDKWALICIRIVMGLGEGTTFPALSALLASWIPEKERGKLGSFVFGGGEIGQILAGLLTGSILHHFNWHIVFYFFGTIAFIWSTLFLLICYNSPAEHPFITVSEQEYLRNEMTNVKRGVQLPPTPWKAIFTSLPIMALISAQIGHDWGFYIMANDLPKFMQDVFRTTVLQNGFYSSLPFIVMWICSTGGGFLCDYMINNNYVTVTNARKALTGIAAIVPGVLLLAAAYIGGESITMVVVLFTVGMGFMGMWYPGMKVNPLDLSPNYAATIMAIANGIGAITGVLAPYAVGVLTKTHGLDGWLVVFWITLAVFVITTVAYTIWASADIQSWNDPNVPERTIGAGKKGEDLESVETAESG